jgi:hypothetical protein
MPSADDFRRIALSFPGAEESSHMNHPDFRVGGKIFATLGSPDEAHGMVSLLPEQQADFMSLSEAFHPASGAWGWRRCPTICWNWHCPRPGESGRRRGFRPPPGSPFR